MKGRILLNSHTQSTKQREYQAYLFDLDGTLVNSEPLKGKALALACQDYGSKADHLIYQDVMGQDWQSVTQHFFKSAKINPDLAEFNQYFRQHYRRLLKDQLDLSPNIKPYLKQLSQLDCKVAVVSSAASWMIEQVLTQLELDNFFDLIISQEDVSRHKPHPEAYLVALKKLNIEAKDALVFEDSFAGLSAANEAGCDVIGIRHEFNIKNDMSIAKICLSDFKALLD